MNLTCLLRSSIPLLAIGSSAVGQWLNLPTREIPRIEDDKPGVAASAPWKPNGKPDSSGKRHVDARNTEPSLTVYVQIGVGDSGLRDNCMRAQGVAYQMFAAAGVRIHWRTGQPKLYDPGRPILIDITSNTPETFHRGALAYARVFEGDYIRVFYDRIENSDRPHATAMLLAHVMAHEITHILEGVNRHSEAGVMKAQWTADDLVQMAYKQLPFGPEDVRLIRIGLAYHGRATGKTPLALIPATQPSQ